MLGFHSALRRRAALISALMAMAYVAGLLTPREAVVVSAQTASSRFVNVGTDGPFRVWKDTRTDQCFIVTTPYFAMLTVGPC